MSQKPVEMVLPLKVLAVTSPVAFILVSELRPMDNMDKGLVVADYRFVRCFKIVKAVVPPLLPTMA